MMKLAVAPVLVLLSNVGQSWSTTSACPWVGRLNVTVQMDGTRRGFHREFSLETSISSKKRFLNCMVTYHFVIPSGAYMDLDMLMEERREEGFLSPQPFDIECPGDYAKAQDLYVCSRRPIVNAFVFQETIDMPIHLRYHKPMEKGTHAVEIKFAKPDILIRCEGEEIPYVNCTDYLHQATCDCNSQTNLCTYFRATPRNGRPAFVATIPVADTKTADVFAIMTLAVVFFACSVVVLFTYFEYYDKKFGGNGQAN